MFRRAALLAALAALLGAVPAGADATRLERHTFPPHGTVGPRDYYVFAPPSRPARPALVVFLHGCNQTAPDVAVGTRILDAAAARGMVVVLPEQRPYQGTDVSDGNGSRCWNWFLPEHQSRDAGEPATIAAITREVMARLDVDPARVYVAGLSAGADMTTILGATYPDLYAAIAPFAGCAYLTCADVSGAAAHRAMGERARPVPAFIAQGSLDMVNNAAMGDTMLRQWLGTDDLADDGAANGSVSPVPASVEHRGVESLSAEPGSGDPCVGSSRLPCAGGVAGVRGGYPTTVSVYAAADGRPLIEHWLIHGLNHAYPGGDTRGTFVDPLGPDVTAAFLDFFLAHPMPVAAAAAAPVAALPTAAAPVAEHGADELPATGYDGRGGVALLLAGLGLVASQRRSRSRSQPTTRSIASRRRPWR